VTTARAVPLGPALAINFIGTLGFSLVLPFLVFLVTDWGGNAFTYGLAGATYSLCQLFGAPILGRWSDRVGRRRVLLISQAGTFLSWLILLAAFALPRTTLVDISSSLTGGFTLTLPLVVLFLARALDGLTGGNVSVANAYVADVTTGDERAAAFGKMAVSSNLGFVLGPAIAAGLGATILGPVAPVSAAALISLMAMVAIVWRLPESNPCTLSTSPEATSVRKVFGQEHRDCVQLEGEQPAVGELLGRRNLRVLFVMHFLVMLGFNFFYVAFPVHAVEGLGWSLTSTGTFFAVMGLAMVVVQGPVLSRLSRRVREPTLIVAGSLGLALGFLLFDTADTLVVYAGVGLIALGNGIMWPSVLALMSKIAGDRYQGAVQGLAGSLGAVASVAGLIVGGALYSGFGARVFWLSATIVAIVAVAGLAIRRGPDAPENENRES